MFILNEKQFRQQMSMLREQKDNQNLKSWKITNKNYSLNR